MTLYADYRTLPIEQQRRYVPGAQLAPKWTRAMRKRYLGDPDIIDQRPYHTKHFYLRSRVEAACPLLDSYLAEKDAKRMEIAELRKNRELRSAAIREKRYAKRYTFWMDALPDAAGALFEMNRWAKYSECCDADAIYRLKNDLIRLLYQRGYCTECYLHYTTLPPKECWSCNGTGLWHSWDYNIEDDCRKCDGTGIYLPETTLAFVVFRFVVGEKSYCWHQPRETVRFEFRTTAEPSEYKLPGEERPVSLTARQRTEAKHLIEWVLRQGSAEKALGVAA